MVRGPHRQQTGACEEGGAPGARACRGWSAWAPPGAASRQGQGATQAADGCEGGGRRAWGPRMSRMVCLGASWGRSAASARTSSAVRYSRRTRAPACLFFHSRTSTAASLACTQPLIDDVPAAQHPLYTGSRFTPSYKHASCPTGAHLRWPLEPAHSPEQTNLQRPCARSAKPQCRQQLHILS